MNCLNLIDIDACGLSPNYNDVTKSTHALVLLLRECLFIALAGVRIKSFLRLPLGLDEIHGLSERFYTIMVYEPTYATCKALFF